MRVFQKQAAGTEQSRAGTMQGMDILVLSPTPTFPLDHGNRKRIHAWCQDLRQRGARIHFVYYPLEWPFSHLPADAMAAMQREWDAFYLAPVTRPLYEWARGDDHLIDEWWDPGIGHLLGFLFGRFSFDAFIINYPFLSKGFEYCPAHTVKILDTHDQFTGRRQLLERNGIEKEFFYTTADQEKIALDRADLIWAIKDEEADFFRTLTDKPVLTLPHAEPDTPLARARSPEDEDYLVVGMLGARNNINRKNAEKFVREARPLFRRHLAPIKIRLAGGMCDDLEDLEALNGVELMGRLDDVADFYRAVDVVIIPMSFSTGLKIKAIEAFSTGVPIVAHGHAVEGIPVEHPFHQCESELEVAEICLDLAYDRERLEELREASVATNRHLHVQFSAALQESCDAILRRPSLVVTLAPEFFNKHSTYREHVLQLLQYLRYLGRVTLYLDALPVLPAANRFELLNGLGDFAKLVIGRETPADDDRDALSESSPGLMFRHQSLSDLLSMPGNRTLWLESIPDGIAEALERNRVRTFARIDSLIALGQGAGAVRALLDGFSFIHTVDSGLFPHIKGQADHFPVPFFRKPSGLFLSVDRKRKTVLLLGETGHLPLMQVLHQLLVQEPRLLVATLVANFDKNQVAAENWAQDKDFMASLLSADDVLHDVRECPNRPVLCVKLGAGPVTDVIDEALLRLGVTSLALHGTLMESVGQILHALDTGADPVHARHSDQFANDSGYTRIWKAIKSGHAMAC